MYVTGPSRIENGNLGSMVLQRASPISPTARRLSATNHRFFVCLLIIQDQVHVQFRGRRPLEGLGELAERRRAMPPVAVAHHAAGGVVQSCKQQCRFVGGVMLRPVLHVPGAKGGERYTA